MSRIVINESDYTTPVATFNTTDVVFVPGFAVEGEALPGVPVLCNSIAEFVQQFGSVAPTFATDQNYPSGFNVNATSGLPAVWFESGSADPSYIYAKELLAQGLPVVYERMNTSTSDVTVEAAYAYLAQQVFVAERNATVPYPTAITYSSSATYAIGDIVSYTSESVLNYYECITAITVAEDFTPAHWNMLPKNQDTNQPLLSLDLPVKYITSGGYPTHEFTPVGGSGTVAGQMITLAETRGDCVALVDYLDNPTRNPVGGSESIYGSVAFSSEYCAMFIPWVEVEFVQSYSGTSNKHMPPSFAYLTALAQDLTFASNTNAVAGIARGQIPNLKALCSIYAITNKIAEETFQPDSGISVNGITKINPYGYRIWGNRTLKSNSGETTATSFLNIRNMISDIKKVAYTAAMNVLFEPNAQITWINFTSRITPFLDTLISNYGLSRYQIDRNTVDSNGMKLAKTVMSATITLYPVYSIEKITINIAIRDDDTVEVE